MVSAVVQISVACMEGVAQWPVTLDGIRNAFHELEMHLLIFITGVEIHRCFHISFVQALYGEVV